MTFAEARAQLQAARDAIPAAEQSALDSVGNAAVDRLEAVSPRDSGEFAEGWSWDGKTLGNLAPYASFVHDGLADRLVPETLDALTDTFATTIERELDAAAGWK